MEERLQKLLSAAGVCSRRRAEEYIMAGRVSVNGRRAELGDKADPARDRVELDGAPLPRPDGFTYIMLNKPRGYVTTLSDERGRRTVAGLVAGCSARVWPVGRLDLDSEGLLLLTNDGPLAHRLLAPKNHVDKVYYVEVDGVLDGADVEAVARGVVLADGYTCLPAVLEPLPGGRAAHITLREGKYHQVKRMLAARGKPVVYLKRMRFGPLVLDDELPKGGWRALTEGETEALFRQ